MFWIASAFRRVYINSHARRTVHKLLVSRQIVHTEIAH